MKVIYPTGLLLAASLSITGCSSIKNSLNSPHQRPDAPVANAINGDKNASKHLQLEAWQQFFKDPIVKKMIGLALKNNRDLHIAAANVAEAEGLYQIQRSALLPDIGVGASRTQTRNSRNLIGSDATSHAYGASVGLASYEIDFWGRIRNLKDAALANYFATLEAQRTSQLTVIAETANAYYNWLAARENLRLANGTLKARTKSLNLIKLRQSVGIASELDFAQAEVAKATVEAQKAQIERGLSSYQAVLELLVGTPIDEILKKERHGAKPSFRFKVPENIDSSVLLNRPDIIAAEEALRAANANISAARAAFLPRISLIGSGGLSSASLGHLFRGSAKTWTFTPSINLPIFGDSNQANLDVAEARKVRSIAQYEKAIQTAFSEVFTQLRSLKARRLEITANNKLANAQRKRLKLANIRYNAGLASYIEVLNAQQDSFTASQALLESERGEVEAIIQLYKALGGGDTMKQSYRQLNEQLLKQAQQAKEATKLKTKTQETKQVIKQPE